MNQHRILLMLILHIAYGVAASAMCVRYYDWSNTFASCFAIGALAILQPKLSAGALVRILRFGEVAAGSRSNSRDLYLFLT